MAMRIDLMEKTLVDLVDALTTYGATQANAATWIDRLDWLRGFVPATLPGQPRMFNVVHATALIFVAAYVKGGARPKQAAAHAAQMIIDVERGAPLPEWMIFAAGNFKSGLPADKIDINDLTQQFGMVPFTMIPIRAIATMVRALYDEVK